VGPSPRGLDNNKGPGYLLVFAMILEAQNKAHGYA